MACYVLCKKINDKKICMYLLIFVKLWLSIGVDKNSKIITDIEKKVRIWEFFWYNFNLSKQVTISFNQKP